MNFRALLACLSLAVCAQAADPIASVLPGNKGYGEIVFVRRWCQGSMNSFSCAIEADNCAQIVIAGEQAGSVFLPAGRHSFQVFSQYPWPMGNDSDARSCSSPKITVDVIEGRRAFFEVIPVAGESERDFSWQIKECQK